MVRNESASPRELVTTSPHSVAIRTTWFPWLVLWHSRNSCLLLCGILQVNRFSGRVAAYLLLMSDAYPSTDEEQYVHLDLDYPDAKQDLNRWLPLVKWLLAFPHIRGGLR